MHAPFFFKGKAHPLTPFFLNDNSQHWSCEFFFPLSSLNVFFPQKLPPFFSSQSAFLSVFWSLVSSFSTQLCLSSFFLLRSERVSLQRAGKEPKRAKERNPFSSSTSSFFFAVQKSIVSWATAALQRIASNIAFRHCSPRKATCRSLFFFFIFLFLVQPKKKTTETRRTVKEEPLKEKKQAIGFGTTTKKKATYVEVKLAISFSLLSEAIKSSVQPSTFLTHSFFLSFSFVIVCACVPLPLWAFNLCAQHIAKLQISLLFLFKFFFCYRYCSCLLLLLFFLFRAAHCFLFRLSGCSFLFFFIPLTFLFFWYWTSSQLPVCKCYFLLSLLLSPVFLRYQPASLN